MTAPRPTTAGAALRPPSLNPPLARPRPPVHTTSAFYALLEHTYDPGTENERRALDERWTVAAFDVDGEPLVAVDGPRLRRLDSLPMDNVTAVRIVARDDQEPCECGPGWAEFTSDTRDPWCTVCGGFNRLQPDLARVQADLDRIGDYLMMSLLPAEGTFSVLGGFMGKLTAHAAAILHLDGDDADLPLRIVNAADAVRWEVKKRKLPIEVVEQRLIEAARGRLDDATVRALVAKGVE